MWEVSKPCYGPVMLCHFFSFPAALKGSNAIVQVALKACQEGAGSVKDIAFILFSEDTYSVWREEAEALGLQPA